MLERTLHTLLESASASQRGVRFMDRSERDTFFSYEEIFLRAARIAGGLEQSGIRHGDRVAIVLPTSIGFFDAFYGVTLAGALPVPLYPPVRLGRLDEYHRRTAGTRRRFLDGMLNPPRSVNLFLLAGEMIRSSWRH